MRTCCVLCLFVSYSNGQSVNDDQSTCEASEPLERSGEQLLQLAKSRQVLHTRRVSREPSAFSAEEAWETFQARRLGRDSLVFESELSQGALAEQARSARAELILGTNVPMEGFVSLLAIQNESVSTLSAWETAGCTEVAPSSDAAISAVADTATSHEASKQKQCYGHAAGDTQKEMLSGSLLGEGGSVRRIQCDKQKGDDFRKAANVSVDDVAQQNKKILFQKIVLAFREIKTPVVMQSGLLLGWWRECDFLAHDHDMDVAVFHRFLPDNFAELLAGLGFDVAIRVPTAARFQDTHDNIGLEMTLKSKTKISSGSQPEPYMDVFVWEEEGITSEPGKPSVHYVFSSLWPNGAKTGFWNCTNEFESLALTRWNDVDVWVPYPPEASLKRNYGDTWNVLLKTGWCVYCNCNKHALVPRQPWTKAWNLADADMFLATEEGLKHS